MRKLPPLTAEHLASGYGSDDEGERPKRRARPFGALEGDEVVARKLSREELLEYGSRQHSSGPHAKKCRYLDALRGTGLRPSPAQTRPRTAFERHIALLSFLPAKNAKPKGDLQLLRESHRFLRDPEDDDGSWEASLAQRYYDRLFKEYVICDLAGFKKGCIGLRWRTEAEVHQGKGQFRCGHKRCACQTGLRSFEVDFKYTEAGRDRRALVKARVCEDCAYKLHYRRLKAEQKRQKGKESHEVKSEHAPRNNSRGSEGLGAARGKHEKGTTEDKAESSDSQDDKPSAPSAPSDADKRLLEAMAWSGSDPQSRTREDDIDDYLHDLFM